MYHLIKENLNRSHHNSQLQVCEHAHQNCVKGNNSDILLFLTARAFGTLSYLTFILMLILMAKGYTITRGKLTSASTIKISVFFTLYFVTFVVLFIYEALVRNYWKAVMAICECMSKIN